MQKILQYPIFCLALVLCLGFSKQSLGQGYDNSKRNQKYDNAERRVQESNVDSRAASEGNEKSTNNSNSIKNEIAGSNPNPHGSSIRAGLLEGTSRYYETIPIEMKGPMYGVSGYFRVESGEYYFDIIPTYSKLTYLYQGGYNGSDEKIVDRPGKSDLFTLEAFFARDPTYNYVNPSMKLSEKTFVSHRFGVFFKVLNDKISGQGSYTRGINQMFFTYSPSLAFPTSSENWNFNLQLYASVLIAGSVKSHLNEVDLSLPAMTNTQGILSGTRVKLELSSVHDLGTTELRLTPFGEYFSVGDSKPAYIRDGGSTVGFLEPENSTTTFGLLVSLGFE